MDTTIRNAELADLTALLQAQQVRKLDLVAPASQMRTDIGRMVLTGTEAQITPDGVTSTDGTFTISDVALGHLADRFQVPVAYLRRIHYSRPDIFDATLNGFLHGGDWGVDGVHQPGDQAAEGDGRSFFLRTFTGDDDGNGILRAVLSDRYGVTDHLDVLVAAMSGVRDSGVEVQVGQCDLTPGRMYVKVHAPSVAVLAPELLAGYTSPFTGETGADNPTMFAGFVLSNSETGGGAWTITPQITALVCRNGMTIKRDVFRKVHLGGRLDHGVVKASDTTTEANLTLVASMAADAVRTFLDLDYVRRKVAEMAKAAGVKLTDSAKVIETVATRLSYTEAQRASVLDMFIKGGDLTAGGVMHAVTAAAQAQANADTAASMEADALDALEFAAAVGTLGA